MKKKVWIVSWYGIQAGGLERIVRILNQVLSDYYNVEIIDIPYICRYKGWKWLMRFESRLVRMFVFSAFIKRIAKKEDFIITHGQNAPFVKSDFLFDHGSIMSLKREMDQFIYGGSSLFEYAAVKNAKMNVAVSDWTKNQIIDNYHIDEERIVVLKNCVETDIFFPCERIETDRTAILFCGRLEDAKGLFMLQQLAEYVESSKDYELKIAANDNQNAELFMGRNNITIQCGVAFEEMNGFYNKGNVLFVPSRCEGFGMGIIESLSAGVPVVANEVGIVRNLVENGCPAIQVIDKEEELPGILDKIQKSAGRYYTMEERLLIHEYVEKNYGMDCYRAQLLRLMKGEADAKGQHCYPDL
ncbi:glycosyltransferase family 4 protein [Lachnospiraceae bacterium 54-11]